tara:strand:+ start:204 stop:701 length:498 start_codon:yes stop_codon:yes gene_type:complete
MWAILKTRKMNFSTLKRELKKKLGTDLEFYYPKIKNEKILHNKTMLKETKLLGGYVFCFHKNFKDKNIVRNLRNTKGLEYFLDGYDLLQKDISSFVNKCKTHEDKLGFLTHSFFDLCIHSNYKFLNGLFANKIFKILKIENNKVKVSLNDKNIIIDKKDFFFYPA